MRFAFALAAAAAVALAGCGNAGGGQETTRPVTSSPPQNAGPATSALGHEEGSGGGGSQAGTGSSGTPSAGDRGAGSLPPARTVHHPLPNQGTKRAAPGVPKQKGGDQSVQTFGTEAQVAARVEAAANLQAFLDARAAGEWQAACSYLAASIASQLEKFGERVPNAEGVDCPQVLKGLSAAASPSALAQATRIQVISFRVEGDHAFIVYRDPGGEVTASAMAREGGGWKLASLGGVPLS